MIKPRRSSNPEPAARKTVRCAIYTRKSTEEGLDQDFNSLDAQRESAEAYIRSQSHEGWKLVPTRYDDGGFSGGNLERPALRALLDDIKAGKVDCVVVYKVDRLSRSLMDFSKLVEVFEAHGVSFVSVTQQFNTTHSMGRLTLNILLSFAQFEREIIGERIRDKLAAHKRKGKWTGGRPVLGYDVDRTVRSPRLVLNQTEAAHVREIYEIYLRTGSLIECTRQVGQRGFATKKVLMRNGRITGGSIRFKGRELTTMTEEQLRQLRGSEIAMIYQEPMASLNPAMKIGRQLMEVPMIHEGISEDEARQRALQVVTDVKLPDPDRILRSYPHQLSGGQQQRVALARAWALQPRLLLLDEPFGALDPGTRDRLQQSFARLRRELSLTVLFVSHDMAEALLLADRIAVMRRGCIVESGPAGEVLDHPCHAYTRELLAAVPRI